MFAYDLMRRSSWSSKLIPRWSGHSTGHGRTHAHPTMPFIQLRDAVYRSIHRLVSKVMIRMLTGMC